VRQQKAPWVKMGKALEKGLKPSFIKEVLPPTHMDEATCLHLGV